MRTTVGHPSTRPESLQESDVHAVGRLQGGESEALRELFERYCPLALRVARGVVRDHAMAEEVVQEVFLSMWTSPQRYSAERGSFRGWLLATVHHKAVDRVRREQTQRKLAERSIPELETIPDIAESVTEDDAISTERARVRAALQSLPSEQRGVIELMYFGGMSQSTVARELGLPLGTVKSRTLLGMRKLRALLVGAPVVAS